MEEIIVYSILILFGLMFGSFAGATVWRIRARQLVEDKAVGEEYDKAEYKKLLPLTKASMRTDRSRCLHCEHTLAWYDLLPLVSWLGLRGKCRYCHKKIGMFEPMMELGMVAFFTLSYLLWPVAFNDVFAVSIFILWLLSGVLLAILFAYDLKWFLLPDLIVYPFIALGAVVAIIKVATAPDVLIALVDVAGSVAILSGLHYVLHKVSKGQWMGFGDVKLGLGLGLLLADWRLAFIALFAANFIGCLIVIPGMIIGKLTRTSRVPFGPMLIVGMIIAMLCGPMLLLAYFSSLSTMPPLL
jgi:prepilin signal peptidase PulO-like enzyme (type II secretory pathway)